MLVSFHDLAKLELNEAAEYYENESSVARTKSSDTRKPAS